MIWQTIALSVITLLLLLLMQTRPAGRIKSLLGILGAVCALAAMACFLLAQRAAGDPGQGRTAVQLAIPVYLLLALWGIFPALLRRGSAGRRKGKTGGEENRK